MSSIRFTLLATSLSISACGQDDPKIKGRDIIRKAKAWREEHPDCGRMWITVVYGEDAARDACAEPSVFPGADVDPETYEVI